MTETSISRNHRKPSREPADSSETAHEIEALAAPPESIADRRIAKALEILHQADLGANDFRVNRVASSLNISVSRFRHLFTKNIGISPSRYLKLLRLVKARRMLEMDFLRVKEIMVAVGINDFSHFVRDYLRVFGHNPTEARLRI